MTWTPEQITDLITKTGAVVGAIITLVKLLHNNRIANESLSNSVPVDLAHKMVDNQNQQATQNSESSGTTSLEVKAPATIEVKETEGEQNPPTAPNSLEG